jgi:SAM-dependent methyltransferase
VTEAWAEAGAYEPFMGRWSRLVADRLIEWLEPRPGRAWLDAGCGTGALSQAILERCEHRLLLALDRSFAFVRAARALHTSGCTAHVQADATALPVRPGAFDIAVSGLVLNFVPEPARMVAELARAVRPGGVLALYVWDYADRMELLRYFWDAAVTLRPQAAALDEGQRFPLCRPGPLRQLLEQQGISDVEVAPLDVATIFGSFHDYWQPFLGGQGPAPGYVATLDDRARTELRQLIRSRLPFAHDGSFALVARAWGARGRVAPP